MATVNVCKNCGYEYRSPRACSVFCCMDCKREFADKKKMKKPNVSNLAKTMRVLDRVGMKYSEYQRLEYEGKVNIVGDQLVRS